jgi:hypothetical protein
MWEAIKAYPWTFAIGGAILLVAIVSVIIGVIFKGFWKDHGLMVRNGVTLKWDVKSLPIGIVYHPALDARWLNFWRDAIGKLQMAMGKRLLFVNPVAATEGAISETGWPPAGFLFLRQVEDYDAKPSTNHRYHPDSGEVDRARVNLPPPGAIPELLRPAVVLHEAGHVLCLAHDEHPESIMYHNLASARKPGKLSKKDIKLLKKTYG